MATFPEDEDEEENFAKYAMRNTLAGVCKLTGYGKTVRSSDSVRSHKVLAYFNHLFAFCFYRSHE